MTEVLDLLAVAAFAAMWIFCERRNISPIELVAELVERVEQAARRSKKDST